MRFRPFSVLLPLLLPLLTSGPLSAQNRGWLGVEIEGDRGEPPRVVEVVPESPAAKGGLRVGDRILRLDRKPAGDIDQFIEKIFKMRPGARIVLGVRRGERERNVRIRLTRRPGEGAAREGSREKVEKRKVSKQKPTKKRPGMLGVYLTQGDEGVRVQRPIPGSAASKAGLKAGDRIVRAQNKPVTSMAAFTELVRSTGAGEVMRLMVDRRGREREFKIRLTGQLPPLPGGGQERERERQHAERERGEKREHDAKREHEKREHDAKREHEKRERAEKRERPKRERAKTSGGVRWHTNLHSAHALAKRQKRPLVVDFYADWCKPCKMLADSFSNERVQGVLKGAVAVKVDVDKNAKLADEHGVSAIPHVIVMSPQGKKLGQFTGFLPADTLAERLGRWVGKRGGAVTERSAARSRAAKAAKDRAARAAKVAKDKVATDRAAKAAKERASRNRRRAAQARARAERSRAAKAKAAADKRALAAKRAAAAKQAARRRVTGRSAPKKAPTKSSPGEMAEIQRAIRRLIQSQERTNKLLEQILRRMDRQ